MITGKNNRGFNPTRLFKGILLAAVVLLATNCVTWYTGEPDEDDFLRSEQQPIDVHYSVRSSTSSVTGSGASTGGSPEHARGVRRAMELSGFFRTSLQHISIVDYQEREKGKAPLFLDINVLDGSVGGGQLAWAYIDTALFLAALPAYLDSDLTIECSLYRYNQTTNTYEKVHGKSYDTKENTVYWLLAIPFVWVNLFTGNTPEIVELAVLDYLHTTSRIGLLK